MAVVVWRVEVLVTPCWRAPCARCGSLTPHRASDRFRVNAHAGRLDVWLLYRCTGCGRTRKRRLHRRRQPAELGDRLAAYLANDAETARRHVVAFEGVPREPLPYRVARPPLPAAGALRARIEQPVPSGVRWDRFLARELRERGWSRSAVTRAWRRGALRIAGVRSPTRLVASGQRFELDSIHDGDPRAGAGTMAAVGKCSPRGSIRR